MAAELKPVDVPQVVKTEETPAAPAIETAKEETPVVPEVAAATEEKPAEEVKPVEAAEETKAEEAKEEVKEEVKPIEEGQLGHKAQGASFPKNLIASKEFFFFGTDAYEPKALTSYQKNEKSSATYQSNVAWASETGKGLLFIGDKKTPTGVINLSDATEPETEGTHKFTLTSKGNKHSFKAGSTAERDNWVAQLKLKIAEAKELVATVTESETYKKTLEDFKPAAPVKKEEKVAEAPKEEAVVAEEAPKAEDAPKEEAVAEPAKDEEKKEEKVEEKPALKGKRASFFGFMDKKEKAPKEEKKEVKAEEAKPEEAIVAPVVPVEEPKVAEEAKPVEETKPEEAVAEEAKPAESPKEKANKRNSFFGGILSKKEKKVPETKPAEATEAPKEAEVSPTTETAPVIPPVEATTPLADAVNDEAKPTETEAAVETEAKKDPKEKRKSSLPFAFGKRDKSPAPVEGEEKPQSAFSKLRATIKGKSAAPKAEEKPAEEVKATEETPAEEVKAEDKPAEVKPVEEAAKEEAIPKPVEAEPEVKPEAVATTTPAVTAAA